MLSSVEGEEEIVDYHRLVFGNPGRSNCASHATPTRYASISWKSKSLR